MDSAGNQTQAANQVILAMGPSPVGGSHTSGPSSKPSTTTSIVFPSTASMKPLRTANGASPQANSQSDSVVSNDDHRNIENLSKTNLYIRGLASNTNDQDLYNMCRHYGPISSTKAILDKVSGCCRGK